MKSTRLSVLLRCITIGIVLLLIWQAIVWITGVRPFILPPPLDVFETLYDNFFLILDNAAVTFLEIILGFFIGTITGCLAAIILATRERLGYWLMPILVISQAIPVFALAPVLVLWLGFGLASKIAMATLILFFPVTAAFYDGLKRTQPGWLDLSTSMNASRWAELRHVRLPAALPALLSGVRVAAAVAPIGAVIGEWVGSSKGLGHLLLLANARMKVDLMFASTLVLAIMALAIYYLIDALGKKLLPWQSESHIQK